jgi:monoamine oxidase
MMDIAIHSRETGIPADELLDPGFIPKHTRREFLKFSGMAALSIGGGRILSACRILDKPGDVRIAIVGAGIAGLNTAYILHKAGIRAEIYEASSRAGGRMFSVAGAMGAGLVTEFGGEFIDSTHKDIFSLAKEFGLEVPDRKDPAKKSLSETFFFNGRKYTERQVLEEFKVIAPKIAADAASLGENYRFENPNQAAKLDNTSLEAYFSTLGVKGWLRELLEVAYVTEFGLELSEQSSINFLSMIGTDTTSGKFEIFGSSDERYKIKGGNESIPRELAKRLEGQLNLSHALESIKPKGKGFTLTFTSDGAAKDVDADIVILTLPFSVLRSVDMRIELPPWKKKAIAELGYGTNAKVMAGVRDRVWNKQGYNGEVFTDENFQLAWDNSEMQPGAEGGITFFSGGKRGMDVGTKAAAENAGNFSAAYDKIFPGFNNSLNGNFRQMHWPSYKYSLGSYSCYKPGQWTSIHGAEGKPVGNLFFAGEHTSSEFQGFINGGAESGRRVAEQVLKLVRT